VSPVNVPAKRRRGSTRSPHGRPLGEFPPIVFLPAPDVHAALNRKNKANCQACLVRQTASQFPSDLILPTGGRPVAKPDQPVCTFALPRPMFVASVDKPSRKSPFISPSLHFTIAVYAARVLRRHLSMWRSRPTGRAISLLFRYLGCSTWLLLKHANHGIEPMAVSRGYREARVLTWTRFGDSEERSQ